jgi:hypothetical protein
MDLHSWKTPWPRSLLLPRRNQRTSPNTRRTTIFLPVSRRRYLAAAREPIFGAGVSLGAGGRESHSSNMNTAREHWQSNQRLPRIGFGLIALWPLFQNLLGFCLFETAFYFAYRYGMSFSQACAAPFWFPDSVFFPTSLIICRRAGSVDWLALNNNVFGVSSALYVSVYSGSAPGVFRLRRFHGAAHHPGRFHGAGHQRVPFFQ